MGKKEFKNYVAAAKINIGVDKENQIVVDKGTVVRYNGAKAIIDGEEYNFPRLSSAIKARWLVDAAELGIDSTSYSPQSANIKMRGATPEQEDVIASDATFADEEREVSTLQNFREGQHQSDTQQAARGMVISDQGGEEVAGVSFKTSAGKKSLEQSTRMDRLSQNAIRNLEDGQENLDKRAHFQALERQKMEREIASLKQQLADDQPSVREGIQFRNEGISDLAAGTTRKAAKDELPAGIWDGHGAETVGKVASPLPEQEVEEKQEDFDVENKESRLAMARQMMPNFDWDFGQHWKTKLKSLEQNSNPLFVCTVYAVESSAMKKHIASQFPDLNLGG